MYLLDSLNQQELPVTFKILRNCYYRYIEEASLTDISCLQANLAEEVFFSPGAKRKAKDGNGVAHLRALKCRHEGTS